MYQAQTTEYEKLIAGDFPIARATVTIAGAADLKAGAVLVEGSTAGTYAQLSGATAGTAGKFAVLLEDVTVAEGESANVMVGLTGEYNSAELTFGTGATLAINKNNMIAQGIFAKACI